MEFVALNIHGTQFCIRDYQTLCEKFEKLGSEQSHHDGKRKLNPAIATTLMATQIPPLVATSNSPTLSAA